MSRPSRLVLSSLLSFAVLSAPLGFGLGLGLSSSACSEDDPATAAGAGGAAAAGQGGGGGQTTPEPKLVENSSPECPKTPPASGEKCTHGEDACTYDATDCQTLDARCRSSVWTVLIHRETTCIARQCPPTLPDDGEACEESSISGTNDCLFQKPVCGESKRALCDGSKWKISAAEDSPGCQLPCPTAPPKEGAKCTGYTNVCPFEHPTCGQEYGMQCSGGEWLLVMGRKGCAKSECPAEAPDSGAVCTDYVVGLDCVFKASCKQGFCDTYAWTVYDAACP